MTTAAGDVFSPIRVGTMMLGHRLVVPPHSGGGGALLGPEEQFERMCRYWLARVEGGMQWVGGGPVFVGNPLIPGFEPSGIGSNADGFFRHPMFVERMGRYLDRLPGVDTVVLACGSLSDDALYHELRHRHPEVHLLGDAYAPRRLSFATRQARELARTALA